MRPRIIILLFIFSWTFAFSQKPQKDTAEKIKLTDTAIKSKKADTLVLAKDQLKDRELKVIFQEPPAATDYFKYIFPILTLLLGIGVNKFLDYLKDRKKIIKTGERWKAELSSLELPIGKQIEYLEEFLKEHNREKFDVPRLKVATPLECEVFNSLDKTEFVKFIESKLKKDYKEAILFSGKVNSFISILKSNNENLRLKFNDYLNGTSTHTTKLSLGLQELLREFADYGVSLEKEIQGDPVQIPSYKAMLDLFNSEIMPKMQTGDYDIYELEKKFFIPLFYVLGQLRLDERTKKMSDISSGCISSIKGIKMEKRYLSENITTLISHYNEDKADLKKLLDEFK